MQVPRIPVLLAAAMALASAVSLAQSHKAHVHGVMALDIALDGPVLQVQLVSPQDSVIGHERRPKPGIETTAAAAVLSLLRDAPRWLKPDAAAGCTPGPVTLKPGKLQGAPKPGEKDTGHADVEASVQWRCKTPAALKGVDVLLFDAFHRVNRIDVQLAGGSGPARQTLRKGSRRVVLAR